MVFGRLLPKHTNTTTTAFTAIQSLLDFPACEAFKPIGSLYVSPCRTLYPAADLTLFILYHLSGKRSTATFLETQLFTPLVKVSLPISSFYSVLTSVTMCDHRSLHRIERKRKSHEIPYVLGGCERACTI